MSKHPQIQEQLALYPTLDPYERQPLEQHLATCADCTETLATYTTMDQALHRLVDRKLNYLAPQTMQPSFLLGQRGPAPTIARSSLDCAPPRAPWLKRWLHEWPQPRTFVWQLAGAGVLILLLVALSMLFAAWNPAQEHQIASTPTFEHPLATATPELYGDWGIQVAHQQTATPLATVSLGRAPLALPGLVQQSAPRFTLHGLLDQGPLGEADKAKIATLTTARLPSAQRTVDAICATQILIAI